MWPRCSPTPHHYPESTAVSGRRVVRRTTPPSPVDGFAARHPHRSPTSSNCCHPGSRIASTSSSPMLTRRSPRRSRGFFSQRCGIALAAVQPLEVTRGARTADREIRSNRSGGPKVTGVRKGPRPVQEGRAVTRSGKCPVGGVDRHLSLVLVDKNRSLCGSQRRADNCGHDARTATAVDKRCRASAQRTPPD